MVGGGGMFWGRGRWAGQFDIERVPSRKRTAKRQQKRIKKKKNSLPSLGTTLLPNLTKLTKMHLRGFLKY